MALEPGQAITMRRKLSQDVVGLPASHPSTLISCAGSMGGLGSFSGAQTALTSTKSGHGLAAPPRSGPEICCDSRRRPWSSKKVEEGDARIRDGG